jgi:hypothetical protein
VSTIWIKKFGGVDARRLPETTPSDSLIRGTDGHLTRGGEFEKRAAFVPTYTLPNGTKNLAADASSVYVFGDGATPAGLPAGVSYLRLQHPSGFGLDNVVSWDLFKGVIYAVGNYSGALTHFYGASSVTTRVIAAAFVLINVTSGTAGDTIDIKVAGVSVTGGPVAWAGSVPATITALAAAINSTITSPDYTATGGLFLTVTAALTGSAANGRSVVAVVTGTAVVSPFNPVMSGGSDGYLAGTRYVRTIGTKMYTLSGRELQFSSIGAPLDWDGSAGGVGFGFIDTSMHTSGSEDLTAVVEFRGTGAVFSQRTVQIWALSSDPASNVLQQRLRNTGTSCPRSLTQFGDKDMFYLAENGLRSLRATPYLNGALAYASTYAPGTRADPLIVAKLRSLTETERASVIGLIEPGTGNFWLIMKDTIFVYAYFPDEGVSGWTVYSPGIVITDAVVFNRRVYVRSGNTIYCYGGVATGLATDSTQAEAWTAYLDGGEDPSSDKAWKSFDAAVSGVWALSVGMDPANTGTSDSVATIAATTYNNESIGAIGCSSHISLRFKSQGGGPAVLGAFALHYDKP